MSQHRVERSQYQRPGWAVGWQRRPQGPVFQTENLHLFLHANHTMALIVAFRDDRVVWRDSSTMPHLLSGCKMLIACFHFKPHLSSWKSKASFKKKKKRVFPPSLFLFPCDSELLQILESKEKPHSFSWKIVQLENARAPRLPICWQKPPRLPLPKWMVPTQVVWLFFAHL